MKNVPGRKQEIQMEKLEILGHFEARTDRIHQFEHPGYKEDKADQQRAETAETVMKLMHLSIAYRQHP